MSEKMPLALDRVQAGIEKILQHFCNETGLRVFIKPQLLADLYGAAETSIRFHNIALSKINHHKVVSHIGYWIHRFQPVRIASPFTIKESTDHYLASLREWGLGAEVHRDAREDLVRAHAAFEKSLDKYLDNYKPYTTFPINEFVAWSFIYDEMCAVWYEFLDTKCQPDALAEVQKTMDAAKERFKAQKSGLILSLRYHNYSARTFAMLVEAMFRVKGL